MRKITKIYVVNMNLKTDLNNVKYIGDMLFKPDGCIIKSVQIVSTTTPGTGFHNLFYIKTNLTNEISASIPIVENQTAVSDIDLDISLDKNTFGPDLITNVYNDDLLQTSKPADDCHLSIIFQFYKYI